MKKYSLQISQVSKSEKTKFFIQTLLPILQCGCYTWKCNKEQVTPPRTARISGLKSELSKQPFLA